MQSLLDGFIEMSFCSMWQATHRMKTGSLCDITEERYMRYAKRYGKGSNKMAEAFALLTSGLEDEPHDFLGDVFQALGSADKSFRGQCFTPMSVCDTIANMLLGHVTKTDQRITIMEPALGGGAMLIAALKVLKANGLGPLDFYIWGTDIDRQCVGMSYVQLGLLGIPMTITHGNALWPKPEDKHYPTLVGALYPYRKPKPEVPKLKPRIRERDEPRLIVIRDRD